MVLGEVKDIPMVKERKATQENSLDICDLYTRLQALGDDGHVLTISSHLRGHKALRFTLNYGGIARHCEVVFTVEDLKDRVYVGRRVDALFNEMAHFLAAVKAEEDDPLLSDVLEVGKPVPDSILYKVFDYEDVVAYSFQKAIPNITELDRLKGKYRESAAGRT